MAKQQQATQTETEESLHPNFLSLVMNPDPQETLHEQEQNLYEQEQNSALDDLKFFIMSISQLVEAGHSNPSAKVQPSDEGIFPTFPALEDIGFAPESNNTFPLNQYPNLNYFPDFPLWVMNDILASDEYTIKNVKGDGNCGFYSMLQTILPQLDFQQVGKNDDCWCWCLAKKLRRVMFPEHPTLGHMADASPARAYYLPFDEPRYCRRIFETAIALGQTGVIIINGGYDPSIADLGDPYNYPYLVLDNQNGHVAYLNFEEALDVAGNNPMILYYSRFHWQAVLKIS